MTDRLLAFKARVGSWEYNLQTETSDEDFKEFILPTFDDLYYGKMYSNQVIGEKEDVDTHDIRKLPELFVKANLNFLEVLYSTKIEINPLFEEEINEIFAMRDDIVTMNLPQLYKSCRGMHKNKMSLLEKGTEGTMHLVEEFGYDTKQAQHAFRCENFLVRFANLGFKNFEDAIRYGGLAKDLMTNIRSGEFTLERFRSHMHYYDTEFIPQFELQYQQPFNEDVKKKLDGIIYQMVRKAIK